MVISFVLSVITGVLTGIIVALFKDNRKLRGQRKEVNMQREVAIQEGVLALLRVKLIEYHDRYVENGSIPSYAYSNWTLMYKAYHGLGGNGMIEHMNDDIEELELRNK